jgi:hypothetical protein
MALWRARRRHDAERRDRAAAMFELLLDAALGGQGDQIDRGRGGTNALQGPDAAGYVRRPGALLSTGATAAMRAAAGLVGRCRLSR